MLCRSSARFCRGGLPLGIIEEKCRKGRSGLPPRRTRWCANMETRNAYQRAKADRLFSQRSMASHRVSHSSSCCCPCRFPQSTPCWTASDSAVLRSTSATCAACTCTRAGQANLRDHFSIIRFLLPRLSPAPASGCCGPSSRPVLKVAKTLLLSQGCGSNPAQLPSQTRRERNRRFTNLVIHFPSIAF